jgi:hypothetical protein
MKYQTRLMVAGLAAFLFCAGCQSDKTAASQTTPETTAAPTAQAPTPTTAPAADVPGTTPGTLGKIELSPTATPAPTAAPAPQPAPKQEPAQNAKGVWHYTCSKGCAGGAGTATACAKCGTTLVHNAAYHEGQNPTVATPNPTATPKPEPAQNAKGVWHYTCGDGCAGGAGSAVACAKCGKTLAHNSAYHQ